MEKGPEYYSKIQKEIVKEAVSMLKEGGYLLYSTCTFSRMEDEEVVQWILWSFPEMELVPLELFEGASHGIGLTGCMRLFPHKIQGEGHFWLCSEKMGKLRRKPMKISKNHQIVGERNLITAKILVEQHWREQMISGIF